MATGHGDHVLPTGALRQFFVVTRHSEGLESRKAALRGV
jgi:hypothetical protein